LEYLLQGHIALVHAFDDVPEDPLLTLGQRRGFRATEVSLPKGSSLADLDLRLLRCCLSLVGLILPDEASRSFKKDYSPDCVEGAFSEVHLEGDSQKLAPDVRLRHHGGWKGSTPPKAGGGAQTDMSSAQTPSSEGFGQTPETIEQMLRDVREAFHMDVAFVSEFAGDKLHFRALEGDAESFGWQEGESFPIDESYCKRVLDGRIPGVVQNARREGATKDLRVTSEADMGSYCAVPLVLSDGRLYGTLCCVSHAPDPWLRDRDLGLMERTARWLVEHLERSGRL
jgi:hypothetical protein